MNGFGGIMSAVPLPPQIDLGILMGAQCVLHTQDAAKEPCKSNDCVQSSHADAIVRLGKVLMR